MRWAPRWPWRSCRSSRGPSHATRDGRLDDFIEAYRLLLERGVDLDAGWQAWRLGMVPGRHARDVMGVTVTT